METGSETEDSEQIMHHDDEDQPKSRNDDGEVEQVSATPTVSQYLILHFSLL